MGGEYWPVGLLSFLKWLNVKLILLGFLLLRFCFLHRL